MQSLKKKAPPPVSIYTPLYGMLSNVIYSLSALTITSTNVIMKPQVITLIGVAVPEASSFLPTVVFLL